jgi:hypothetical protein
MTGLCKSFFASLPLLCVPISRTKQQRFPGKKNPAFGLNAGSRDSAQLARVRGCRDQKRSRFITLFHAAMKSLVNFTLPSVAA